MRGEKWTYASAGYAPVVLGVASLAAAGCSSTPASPTAQTALVDSEYEAGDQGSATPGKNGDGATVADGERMSLIAEEFCRFLEAPPNVAYRLLPTDVKISFAS